MNRHQRRAAGKANGAASSGVAATLQIGMANHRAGLLAEAERCYRQVLSREPNNPDALHLIGCLYMQTNRAAQGVASVERAIKLHPGNAEFHSNLAAGFSRLDRLEEAAEAYGRSVDLSAASSLVFNDYGKVLEKLGKTAPALAAYAHGVMVDGMFADAHVNLGRMLQYFERYDEALVSFNAAMALQPDNARTLEHRARLFFAMKRVNEALEDADCSIAMDPDLSGSHNVRGSALHRMGRLDESLISFEHAEKLDPVCAEIALNKATTLVDLHRFDEAFTATEQAIALKPDYAEAHNNMGLLCLLRGEFARGWRETEWRWKCPGLKLKPASIDQPVWLGGTPLSGKTILLHSDQGLGDAINFARYAPLVAEQGARVILVVDPPLVDILKTMDGVTECLSKEKPSPPFDLHCPLSSLPLAFATELETIPATVPYLRPQSSSKWRERLGGKRAPRVGLVWSGNADHANDHNRSLSFAQIAPLLDLPLEFYSLQKDVRSSDVDSLARCERIMPLGHEITSFADTTALLSELDLLITADTSIAHLAGAIAMPVWIMLSHTPDWRWLLGRDDSPWYPTMRLFRQPIMRDWDSVIANIHKALRADYVHDDRDERLSALTARRCNYSLSSVA